MKPMKKERDPFYEDELREIRDLLITYVLFPLFLMLFIIIINALFY